jgi:hypothetical protein
MKWIDALHQSRVHERRTRILAEAVSALLPRDLKVLDVGCGDGLFAYKLSQLRPDLMIEGAEAFPRPTCRIPAVAFDGLNLPYPSGAFGACLLIDVLHEVGNRRHGVPLPFTYFDSDEWERMFAECNLGAAARDPVGNLYPFPANLVFGRRLNFVALLLAKPAAA